MYILFDPKNIIEELNLSNNNITDQGLLLINNLIEAKHTRLKLLDLSFNVGITSSGLISSIKAANKDKYI